MKTRVATREPAKTATAPERQSRQRYASRRARLDEAIAGRTIELPHRAALERGFSRSLAAIPVHCDEYSRAALAELHAEAATYRGHILLETPVAPLRTIAHEVAHALQTPDAPPGPGDAIELAPAPAEVEAESLATRLESRAASASDPLAFVTLRPEVHLSGGVLALRATRTTAAAVPTREPRPAPASEPAAEAAAAVGERTEPARERGAPAAAVQPVSEPPAAVAAGAATPEAAPAPGITPEEVAARQTAVEEARARVAAAGSATGVVEAFADAPPSLKAQLAGELDVQLNGALQHESEALDTQTPPVEAHIEHDAPPAGPVQVEAPPAPAVTLEAAPPSASPPAELEAVTQTPVADPNAGVADRLVAPDSSPERRGDDVAQALGDVQTTNPGIQTSAGPPPAVALEGAEDPQRIENQVAAGHELVSSGLEQARSAVATGPGPERVQPVSMDATAPAGPIPAAMAEAAPAPEGAQEYLAMNLPPDVQTAFDETNGERMRASVAGAQTEMQAAADQRDEQHQAAVEQARTERDTAVEDAEREQQARVGDARRDITRERDATVAAQQAAVERTTQEADTRREADRSQIDVRVADDRSRIDTRYADADASARREVESGERQAEGRRQTAERDAENQGWWDRAVSFVREAFDGLVSAIGAIFDAVRRAVNAILDAARDFAIGLINAVASFVRDAIAAFGSFLTALVETLLADVFPELAAALTALINEAVVAAQRAVDTVAEGLRSAVNAVVETLRAGINAVIGVFQAAVNVAVGVLRAAVTGDWGALARQVFEAVLRALGIEPAAVYEFIGRAESTLQTIIDDPGAFLRHVVDAVTGGISRFADNFLTHLQAGIIGWLTGALGGAGITLPERFDLVGVLSLVQQVLGLTWANLRQRIVRLVGERAVQALEFVASYVQTLVEGGWSALWERIKNDLATLRDMVLEQIRSFLVERIVMAAITRLVTLFNPVGALINLVLAIYNFYTFLRDQMQRIFAVAQAVVNAMSDIARGVIEPAVERVEGVLASLLPLAIDLLARLLGLGNLGERVRTILQRVQDALWGAIDRLIERVLASFRGGGAEAAAPEPPGTVDGAMHVGEQLPIVPAEGERHHLFVEVEGGRPVVYVQSVRSTVEAFLASSQVEALSTRPHGTEYLATARRQLAAVNVDAAAVIALALNPRRRDRVSAADAEVTAEEQQLVFSLRWIFGQLQGGAVQLGRDVIQDQIETEVRRVDALLEIVAFDMDQLQGQLSHLRPLRQRLESLREHASDLARNERNQSELTAARAEIDGYDHDPGIDGNRKRLEALRLGLEAKSLSDRAWQQVRDDMARILANYKARVLEIVPNSRLGFRGSLARGWKGPHKVTPSGEAQRFTPDDFDCDAYTEVPTHVWIDEIAFLPESRGKRPDRFLPLEQLRTWPRYPPLMEVVDNVIGDIETSRGVLRRMRVDQDTGRPEFHMYIQSPEVTLDLLLQAAEYPPEAFQPSIEELLPLTRGRRRFPQTVVEV